MIYNEIVIDVIKRLKINIDQTIIANYLDNKEERIDDLIFKNKIIDELTYLQIKEQIYHIKLKPRGTYDNISFPLYFTKEFMFENGFIIINTNNKLEILLNNLDVLELIMLFNLFINEPYCFYLVTSKEYERLKEIASSYNYQTENYEIYINQDRQLHDIEPTFNLEALNNYPIVKLLDKILDEGINLGASDIHFEPNDLQVIIKMRFDGKLYIRSYFDIEIYKEVITRIKIMADLNITQKLIPQDGKLKKEFQGKVYDLRISTLPTIYGERVSIRVLDSQKALMSIKELGFVNDQIETINQLLDSHHGIILVCGPTGCGKSTTLYAFIKELMKKDLNIITVEDPVEYTIKEINQVQVNPKARLTFATALRSILRQDPNVMMIGEIRDEETAEIATRAAITGHLVLSTMHTNDSITSISRLIDMKVPSYLVSEAILGVISQRLVRRLCDNCKSKTLIKTSEAKLLNISNKRYVYNPNGCSLCNQTGYIGRTAIYEIFINDGTIKKMIVEDKGSEIIRQTVIEKGLRSLFDNSLDLLYKGITSVEEIKSILN